MQTCDCPLKRAAIEDPNAIALIDKGITVTFKHLDTLANQYKFKEGELIPTLPQNPLEFIPLFFGCMRSGAAICPINLRLPCPQLAINQLPQKATPQSVLLFTSGTTGTPKIAILSFRSLLTNAQYSIPLDPTDCYLLSLPLYHVGGIGIILRCILAKASIVLDKNNPNITHLSFVPTQLYRETPIYKNLKCILLGGAPCFSIPSHLPIFATYGLTEMGSMVYVRKHPPLIHGHFHLGLPLPKREVRLGSDGEIFVRGETLFDGYLDQPQSDWLATGDIGIDNPTHGIAIIGRKDWQFISGGENIQPEEIEKYLLQIPGILETVVIPKKDPEFGMRPIAIAKTNGSIELQTIQKYLYDFLPKYKIPTALFCVNELPKIGLKIDRKQVVNTFK
ncbi:MAG TPA: AMP-binding protein [Chlamydiales bacterium]|nr:AMP-binding protein [Chlamydiales bacterium]